MGLFPQEDQIHPLLGEMHIPRIISYCTKETNPSLLRRIAHSHENCVIALGRPSTSLPRIIMGLLHQGDQVHPFLEESHIPRIIIEGPSDCQHDLSEELHLTDELLKVQLGKSFHDNEQICLASWPRWVLIVCHGMDSKCQKQALRRNQRLFSQVPTNNAIDDVPKKSEQLMSKTYVLDNWLISQFQQSDPFSLAGG